MPSPVYCQAAPLFPSDPGRKLCDLLGHLHTQTHIRAHTTPHTGTDCSLISYLVHHLIDNEVTLEEPQLSPALIPKLACSANLLGNLLCLACSCGLHARRNTGTEGSIQKIVLLCLSCCSKSSTQGARINEQLRVCSNHFLLTLC